MAQSGLIPMSVPTVGQAHFGAPAYFPGPGHGDGHGDGLVPGRDGGDQDQPSRITLTAPAGEPLDPLRAELQRVLETAPEWDRRVNVLQLTDVTERTIQIRVLVSARSSSLAFDLRCRVREALVTFIQREYPDCLPQVCVPAQGAEAPTRPLEQEPPLKA